MDVWEIIRRSVMNDGLAAEEREAVLDFCSDHTSQMAELRSAAESAEAEKQRLSEELGALKRSAAVSTLAERHKFTDPGYLDYLLQKKDVCMDDPAAVEAAVALLKEECPRFFRVDIVPGTSSGIVPEQTADCRTMRQDLAAMVKNAPEVCY